jgi:GNAT superfamily N-acetyltransferase
MHLSIRLFESHDIDFAVAQTSREGWDATCELFETLLAHDPHGCFIAEQENQRTGMITTTMYRRSAWIGNLITLPQHRRQGVGRRLMTHAMKHLSRQGVHTIRLEADPPGVGLYRRLGFTEEFESLRFTCRRPVIAGGPSARRLHQNDLAEIAAFDAEIFGDDRREMLEMLLEQSRAAYWTSSRSAVCAYAMALPSAAGIRIGPWVASDREAAEEVFKAVLRDVPGETVTSGVPCVNTEATNLLTSLGFDRSPSCLRMSRGERDGYGAPHRVFGVGSGATG